MKRTTIMIDEKPFTYDDEWEDISYDTIKPITQEQAYSLLETTKKLFGECDIFFFLAYGTLLGAVRDHKVIEGDEDVDIFIEDEEKLIHSIPYLFDNGLKLCRACNGILYSFRNGDSSYIDVYPIKPVTHGIWKYWCKRHDFHYYPSRYISSFEKIEFLGGEYYIPTKPERILSVFYGKTWNTPIKGHGLWEGEVHSHYLWKTKGLKVYNKIINHLHGIIKWT